MVQMSKYKIKESIAVKISELLFEVLGRANNKEQFIATLYDVLSPIERLMIGKRLLMMYMLYLGIDYDVICDVAKVSRGTIAKFSFIFDKSTCIKQSLSVIATKGNIQNLFTQLISSVNEPGVALVDWKAAWKLKRKIQKQEEQGF